MTTLSSFTGISVVIPTYNRSRHVTALLKSLCQAKKPYNVPSEIIVVDSSDENESSIIMAACNKNKAQYLKGSQSVRQKRNYGVDKSQYSVILFIDSDCIVHPNLLIEHAKIHQSGDDMLGGVYGLTRFTGKRSKLWQVIERTPMIDVFSFAEKYPYVQWAIGNNISYCKNIFQEVGGFDTTFPFRLGGDDLDLGLRITQAGYYIKTNPKAITFHTRKTWNSLRAILDRTRRWGRMDYHIYQKHSFLRQFCLPKRSIILFLISFVAIGESIILLKPRLVFLPFIWLIIVLLIDSTLNLKKSEPLWPTLMYEMAAQTIRLFYETNTFWEFLRHGRLSIFFKRIIFSTQQIQIEWKSEVRSAWSHISGLLLLLILILFL
jgi:glycosyltransferase involved in cell wall biosynthesis